MNAEAIAFHGWGFDGSMWHPWEEPLADRGIILKTFDRGYYGNPVSPIFSPGTRRRLVITHSFGLHVCPSALRQSADLLIIFSGFNPFHPAGGPEKRRSERLHRAMCNRFRDAPAQVLAGFFRQCGYPASPHPEPTAAWDIGLLQRDLSDLAESAISPVIREGAQTVLILHGSEDRIVPADKGRELASQFGTPASYFEIGDAGHALPFTHANECWRLVEPHLPQDTR